MKTTGWTPEGREHYDNERAARKAGLSDKTDRSKPTDMRMSILAEIDRLHPMGKGGDGLDEYPTLRPMRHRVFARRRVSALSAQASAAGLVVPELVDKPTEREGWLCDVLVVGPGVTSVRVGDCVVAHHALCWDRGAILGTGVVELAVDCPSLPDKPADDSDRARGCWGVVDAVLLTGDEV